MIPEDINVEGLSGPKKGVYPAFCYVEDQIYWNQSQTNFVIVYTIFEASMGNYIGYIAWGTKNENGHEIIENPQKVIICCWERSYCKWLDESTFIFKIQTYEPATERVFTPLVAINLNKGFSVLAGTNDTESRVSGCCSVSDTYSEYDPQDLIEAVKSQP